MRWLVIFSCLATMCAVSSVAQPVEALRFEGMWKLNGPTRNSRLEFQVSADDYTATYFHPFASVLYDLRIHGDSFTAWYIDDYGSHVNLTAQLRGTELQLALAPEGRPPILLSGVRTAPEQVRSTTTQRVSGSFSKTGKSASGEVTAGGHTFVFSGGVEGTCVSGSVGKDGKGVSVHGCASISVTK